MVMGSLILIFLLGLAVVSMFSSDGRGGCLAIVKFFFSVVGVILVGFLTLIAIIVMLEQS